MHCKKKKKINQINLKKINQNHSKMEAIFMDTENSKTNESNKIHYYFIDMVNLKDLCTKYCVY